MSAVNKEAQSSSGAPQFRQGALDAAQIRGECPQFRILVIGKANAGKTTILGKVCNAGPNTKPTTYDEEGKEVRQEPIKSRFSLTKVFGQRKGHVLNPSTESGEHNIEHQLTYAGSNFIFHDSRGIESGSIEELDIVKEFIQTREQNVDLKDQLHVIWYCVPMDDQRPISGAEKTFFSFGTGRVPVVLIFTKFDALEDKSYSKLRDQGKEHQEAEKEVSELADKIFKDEYLPRVLDAEFPPKTYVCLAEMNKETKQCSELSEKTMDILDNDVLVNLFVSTQKNNLNLCIKKGIESIWKPESIHLLEIISGFIPWFPNFWNPSGYKMEASAAAPHWARSWARPILKILSQQFPFVFSPYTTEGYQGLLKFQAIAVLALLAEHSFWFSGSSMEEQFSHAVKSFESQTHISVTTVQEEVEATFNNASDKQDSAWLIQWVIENKLKHK
jgi:GTPase Era involved in 16S rRNA processing